MNLVEPNDYSMTHMASKQSTTYPCHSVWIKSGKEILRSRRSLAIVAGMKKTNDHAEPTKRRTLKR